MEAQPMENMNTFSANSSFILLKYISKGPILSCGFRVPCPTDRLLSQLLRQGLAVHLSRLGVLLSLRGLLDPADEARVSVSVLLQGRAQALQVGPPATTTTTHSSFPGQETLLY